MNEPIWGLSGVVIAVHQNLDAEEAEAVVVFEQLASDQFTEKNLSIWSSDPSIVNT